jgi:flagellar protein FliL
MKILLVALLLVITIIGGLYFTGGLNSLMGTAPDGTPVQRPTIPIYASLEPPFVVNFTHRGALRFLQLSMDVMFYDQTRIDMLHSRMPAIRNDIILLLSDKDFDTLNSVESKEIIRQEILEIVSKNLNLVYEQVRDNNEAEIYFTNFIMQ